jgi:hypothetical protein
LTALQKKQMTKRDLPRLTDAALFSRFFEPFDPILSEIDNKDLNAAINSDGALSAYAETVIWRLRGVRAMVT